MCANPLQFEKNLEQQFGNVVREIEVLRSQVKLDENICEARRLMLTEMVLELIVDLAHIKVDCSLHTMIVMKQRTARFN